MRYHIEEGMARLHREGAKWRKDCAAGLSNIPCGTFVPTQMKFPITPVMSVLQSILARRITNDRDVAICSALAHIITSANSDEALDARNGLSLAQLVLWDYEKQVDSNFTLFDLVDSPIGMLLHYLASSGTYQSFFDIQRQPYEGLRDRIAIAVAEIDNAVLIRWKDLYGARPLDVGSVFSSMYFPPSKGAFVIEMSTRTQNLRVHTVCEIGFLTGGSAVGWLELFPNATVISFDLGVDECSYFGQEFIAAKYGSRHEMHWGNSIESIPRFAATTQRRCDVIMIDGCKDFDCRQSDFHHITSVASPGALVFVDDVDANVMHEEASANSEPTAALRDWLASGFLLDLRCFTPFSYDIRYNFEGYYGQHFRSPGLCAGHLAAVAP